MANLRGHGQMRNGVRAVLRSSRWARLSTSVLGVLAVVAVTASCGSNHRDPQLERGWVTNCVGPEFRRFSLKGAAGLGPERPVFRINDQLVLAVPKEYWPWSQSIDHEPRSCTKVSDLPTVGFVNFYFQGKWSAGYNPSEVPFGISGQRVQPDNVMVRIERKEAEPNLSAADRRALQEKREKDLQEWNKGAREIAGLTCNVYCWEDRPRDSDRVSLKYQQLNASFVEIYAGYASHKYGGTRVWWTAVTSDLSHWREIDDEVWKLIAEWDLLNNQEAQAEPR